MLHEEKIEPDIVTRICIPAFEMPRQEDYWVFQANLGYIASSKPNSDKHWDLDTKDHDLQTICFGKLSKY